MSSYTYWYLEDRYYCNVIWRSVTVSLEPQTWSKCLQQLHNLHQSSTNYLTQIQETQQLRIRQPQYSWYRTSYIETLQARLLQTRISHTQIKRSMVKFEKDLFDKTMLYIQYRYRPIRNNLINTLTRRSQTLEQAINEWDSKAVERIIQRYTTERRRLEMINLMLAAKTFEDLMPFYSIFSDIPQRDTLWK